MVGAWIYFIAGLVGLIVLGVSFFQWNDKRNNVMNALYALGLVLFLVASAMILAQPPMLSRNILIFVLTLAYFSLLYGMLIWAQQQNGYSNTGLLATSHIIAWLSLLGMLGAMYLDGKEKLA